MATLEETVKQGLRDIQALIKQVKESDEQDLGKMSDAFDEIASVADGLAVRLETADKSLSGDSGEDESQEQDTESQEDNQSQEDQSSEE